MRISIFLAMLSVAASSVLCAARAGTFMQLNSQPREYIGQGVDRRIEGDAWNFVAAHNPIGNDVVVAALGKTARWDALFSAADGAPLVAGSYSKAEVYSRPGHPRLSITGESRSCGLSVGSFVVHEV